jgi:hypothetical protein
MVLLGFAIYVRLVPMNEFLFQRKAGNGVKSFCNIFVKYYCIDIRFTYA